MCSAWAFVNRKYVPSLPPLEFFSLLFNVTCAGSPRLDKLVSNDSIEGVEYSGEDSKSLSFPRSIDLGPICSQPPPIHAREFQHIEAAPRLHRLKDLLARTKSCVVPSSAVPPAGTSSSALKSLRSQENPMRSRGGVGTNMTANAACIRLRVSARRLTTRFWISEFCAKAFAS